jgi:hypothetical protein
VKESAVGQGEKVLGLQLRLFFTLSPDSVEWRGRQR